MTLTTQGPRAVSWQGPGAGGVEGGDEQNKIPAKRPDPQAQGPEFLFFSNTRGNSRAKNSNELRMVLFL